MKLFLRGALAMGVSALFAAAAFSDTPTAKTPILPQPPATSATAATPTTSSCGCAADGAAGRSGRSRRLGNRGDASTPRIDKIMQSREEGSQKAMELFKRLAGPPVNPQPAGPYVREPKPTSQPGTVVFPQHPFARSPRDFFMQD